jgi:LacI family transcriptional regulator
VIFEDVANPFQAAVLRGVETVARARGVLTMVGSSDDDGTRERELVEAFASRRVDGLILVPTGTDHGYLRTDVDAGLPVVFVDRPPALLDADSVLSDNAGGTAAAAAHLIAAGHRRIGYLGDEQRIYTAAERVRGYRETLADHGIPHDPALVRLELRGSAMAAAAAAELLGLADPPTALLSGQNLITVGVIHSLRGLGRQHDVALVGFDDLVLADALEPALTVIAQDATALGRAAAERLFARLDGEAGPTRRILLPTTLIPRGSGELVPA